MPAPHISASRSTPRSTPHISAPRSGLGIQEDLIVDAQGSLGRMQIVCGRWNKRFGVWKRRGPNLPAERYLPDWPVLDSAGRFCRGDDAICCDDVGRRGKFVGDLTGGHPPFSRSATDVLREFVEEIPLEVRRAAGRLGPFQWRALEGMARFPELVGTFDPGRPLSKLLTPLACWAITEDEGDVNTADAVNAAIANGRTRQFIRNWIGPRGGHFATAVGKLDVGIDGLSDAVRTLETLVSDTRRLRICAHLRSINKAVLDYLDYAFCLSDELFLPNIAAVISNLPCAAVNDFFQAVFFEDIANGEAQEARVREILRSVRCADTLERATRKLRIRAALDVEFPPAPFASKAPLMPIASSKALAEEAERMEHCAESHVEDAAQGSMYFYRWDDEPAVTLALERADGAADGAWGLKDARCAQNDNVPVAVLRKILTCLELDGAGGPV